MKCHYNSVVGKGTLGVLVILVLIESLALGQSSNSSCVAKTSCGECIRSPDCVWCSQPKFERQDRSPLPRCNTATKHQALSVELRCESEYLINPNNQFQLVRDEEIARGSDHKSAVQIRPQHVSLRLRVGQPYDIQMQYAEAEDYPVDLYYLMDLSKSMEDDKEQLSTLGDTLAQVMRKLTSNFRLGFGSFVDKVVMPFVSTVQKNLVQPCPGCEAPYGYQNVMSLSQDTSRFAVEVRNARVSGNLDAPEGGFDAIMQAIVCNSDIGWRERARRLLVFSTDASFHYAGDGKLGGIVKPNDGLCHMDGQGEYTHSTIQDYPSVAQINSKVKENSINMIFAVTAEQIDIYKRLSAAIEGATCGTLSANSSNVVELVREQYQKITSSVTLKDTASGNVRVSYFSKCLTGGTMTETNTCDGLRVGEKVEFTVKVEVTECPKNRAEWDQSFTIYRVGINENITVDLTMLCECPCEIPGNPGYGVRSPWCNFKGTAKCGICDCHDSFFGRRCECDASSGSRSDDDRGCKADNTTDIICSSRGTCVCGQCECQTRDDPEEKIEGTYCECDNFSCERENGVLCSGTHGRCECGKCTCFPGWSGSACQCATDVSTCIEPGKTEVCGGKGKCECGQCVCTETETERYSGRFCQKCPTCKGRCEEYKDCVQCKVHKTGTYREEEDCERYCRSIPPIEEVDVVNNEENDEHYCLFTDEDDNCRFYFVYGYDEVGSPYIKAQKTKDCPPEPPVFWIVAGVVGAIVIIGLLFLLLWKLLTHIHDRAEYARFEKERMSAKWDTGENPIYKQATSTFKNPMYSGK